MKSVSESTRIGLSAYAVDQLTKDTTSLTGAEFAARKASAAVSRRARKPRSDQKGRVFGVGPEVAYIHGAGDYLIDGRIMKEFGAETRPKGFTAIVTLSKPF